MGNVIYLTVISNRNKNGVATGGNFPSSSLIIYCTRTVMFNVLEALAATSPISQMPVFPS